MENTYSVDLRKIYLQNFTQATDVEILLFSEKSYALGHTVLMRKNILQEKHFELTTLGDFLYIEFRVFAARTLIASEVIHYQRIEELFYCPVDIEISLLRAAPAVLTSCLVYAAVNLVIDAKFCGVLFYEFECGKYSVFKRIKDQCDNYECVELIIEEKLPQSSVFTVFYKAGNIFLPIMRESFENGAYYVIQSEYCISNELSMLIKEYNRAGKGDFYRIAHSFPIYHPVFSYTISKCERLPDYPGHVRLRPSFFTVQSKFEKLAFAEQTFSLYKKDFENAHFMVYNVFYYKDAVPFIAIQGGYFATFVSYFIFNAKSISVFCNGEMIELSGFQFPEAADKVIVSVEPYRFELYGVCYVEKRINIEDEEIDAQDHIVTQSCAQLDEPIVKMPETRETAQMRILDEVITQMPRRSGASKRYIEAQRPPDLEAELYRLQFIIACWKHAGDSLASLPLCKAKNYMTSVEMAEFFGATTQFFECEAEPCDKYSFCTMVDQLPSAEKIRLIMSFLSRICASRAADMHVLENEVIIQHLSRAVQQRAADMARRRRLRIAVEISECEGRIRALEQNRAE